MQWTVVLFFASFGLGAVLPSHLQAEATPQPTFATVPITKRNGHLNKPGSTRLDRNKLLGHLKHLRGKHVHNLDTYRSNTGTAHPYRPGRPRKQHVRATSKLGLNNVDDFLWMGTILLGTPPQPVNVQFDTGSADTLLNPGVYQPNNSATSAKTSRTFSTFYGDGTTAAGVMYRDVITVGNLKAPFAAIGLAAQQFINPEDEGGSQGISGMAFQSLSAFNHPSFFDTLRYAGVLSAPTFSFRLTDSGSSLTLGGVNNADINGNITWSPVNPSNGYWAVSGRMNSFGPITAIMDTGTSCIVAPVNDALTTFKALNLEPRQYDGVYYGAYNCSNPPKMSFTFSNRTVTLAGVSRTIGTDDDGSCLASIIGQDIGVGGAWILGDSFLRNFISIFDKAGYRFGIGARR
ncbi:hypothetical protein V8E36_007423 [Tilletia maclaganii]